MSARGVLLGVLAFAVAIACTSEYLTDPGEGGTAAPIQRSARDECELVAATLDSFALQVGVTSFAVADSTIAMSGLWESIDSSYLAAHRAVLIDSLGLDPAAWEDYLERSRSSGPLCHSSPERLTVVFASPGALSGIARDSLESWQPSVDDAPWDWRPRMYMVRFSRIGWSRDGRQALLEIGGNCGPLCGSGWFVVLERDADRWRVRGMLLTWVS